MNQKQTWYLSPLPRLVICHEKIWLQMNTFLWNNFQAKKCAGVEKMTNIRFDCNHQSSPLLGLLALSDLSLSLVQLQAIQSAPSPEILTRYLLLALIAGLFVAAHLSQFNNLMMNSNHLYCFHKSLYFFTCVRTNTFVFLDLEVRSASWLRPSCLWHLGCATSKRVRWCVRMFMCGRWGQKRQTQTNNQADSRKKRRFPTEEQPWLVAQFSISVGLHLFSLFSLITCACVHLLLLLCQPHQYQVATLKLIKVSTLTLKLHLKYSLPSRSTDWFGQLETKAKQQTNKICTRRWSLYISSLRRLKKTKWSGRSPHQGIMLTAMSRELDPKIIGSKNLVRLLLASWSILPALCSLALACKISSQVLTGSLGHGLELIKGTKREEKCVTLWF